MINKGHFKLFVKEIATNNLLTLFSIMLNVEPYF